MKTYLQILLFCILFVAFNNQVLAQYNFNGSLDNCNASSIMEEYKNASHINISSGTSSTCLVNDFWADIYEDSGSMYFILGMDHGNSGNSNFRLYVNTDCDNTTGAFEAPKNLGDPCQEPDDPVTPDTCIPVGGADFYVNFTTGSGGGPSGQVADVYKWDDVGNAWTNAVDGNSKTGDWSCRQPAATGTFVEVRIPFAGNFDPCDNNSCGQVELTTIISNAGGSPSSNYCSDVGLTLEVPVNNPPSPDFTTSLSCDIDNPLVGGHLPIIKLEPTSLDVDLSIGDILSYSWSYYLNGDLSTMYTTGFSNQSGSNIQNATQSQVETTFQPTITILPAQFTFVLTLTDSFQCGEESSSQTYHTMDLRSLTPPECLLLPIQLSSFTVDSNNMDAQINWTTLSESNNELFEVQRSIDGVNFDVIGTVQGANNSQIEIEYTYIDKYAITVADNLYYRIKQVDFDGLYSYTPVRLLIFDQIDIPSRLFPSLATNSQDITLQANQIGLVEVYSVWGELVNTIDGQNQKATTIDTSNLSPGIYLVLLNKNEVLKFIIQ